MFVIRHEWKCRSCNYCFHLLSHYFSSAITVGWVFCIMRTHTCIYCQGTSYGGHQLSLAMEGTSYGGHQLWRELWRALLLWRALVNVVRHVATPFAPRLLFSVFKYKRITITIVRTFIKFIFVIALYIANNNILLKLNQTDNMKQLKQ